MSPSTDSVLDEAAALLAQGEPARALALLEPLLAATDDAGVLLTAGRALNNLGRLEEAEEVLRRAAGLAPDNADVLAALGHVLARRGDAASAEAAWRRALAIEADHLRALGGLARLCAGTRRLEEAAALYRRVTVIAPEDPEGWLNLAELSQFLEDPVAAEAAYRRAAALAPGRAEVHTALGRLRYANGEMVGAERAYARALAVDPDDAAAAAGRALCLEVLGRRDEGLALLAPFLESGRLTPIMDFAAGRLLAGADRHEEAAAHLARATGAADAESRRNPQPWYDYGRVLEKLGRPDEAFAAWAEANRRKPAVFDPVAFARRVEAVVAGFPAQPRAPATPDRPGPGVPRPLFIVGMPRSGTTLVEQMLACHPRVAAGGERLILETMAGRLWEGGARVRPSGDAERQALRQQWLERIGPVAPGVAFYTDKFPANFLHLGLARELLPELAVVWCRRDPADTALSIFATDFNRRVVPWATRLEDIAEVWRAQERLMRHWRDARHLPVAEIRYESLVLAPERELRRLLDALGLPWDDACLRFHESDRLANTASFDQVRQPLYASSVGRGRRFARHLDPFLSAIST